MERSWTTSTKERCEEFKKSLGKTQISNCFKDFLTDIHDKHKTQ